MERPTVNEIGMALREANVAASLAPGVLKIDFATATTQELARRTLELMFRGRRQ